MSLLSIHELSIGFRGPLLLDQVNCRVAAGDRIGLLGRNGAGKTTLLHVLAGGIEPDHGHVTLAPGSSISILPQEVPSELESKQHQTIREVVMSGLPNVAVEDAWRQDQLVEQRLAEMDLAADALFAALSAGMKRRALLARALVTEPDILLLDEPTNHLDIASIGWLENFLQRWPGTLIFVTHDRMFLRRIANRILEIDRGRLFDWTCDYDTFLKRKEAALAAEEKQNALFDKKLAQEEAWIRQGIKARRTRNEGRVRALHRMRDEFRERRNEARHRETANSHSRRQWTTSRRSRGNLVPV